MAALISELPFHILECIFLLLRNPGNLASSCKVFFKFAKDPLLRLKHIQIYQNAEFPREILDTALYSKHKGSVMNSVPRIFRKLLNSEQACTLASNLDLELELIELTWHYATIWRYYEAVKGFVANFEQNLKRLEDGSGKASTMLGVRAAYGLKVAIYNSDIEHIKIYLSSGLICRFISEFLETSAHAHTFSPLLYHRQRCSFPFIEEILCKVPSYVTVYDSKPQRNPLQLAVYRGNFPLACAILAIDGSNVLIEGKSRCDSIHEACWREDGAMLKLLLVNLPVRTTLSSLAILEHCAKLNRVNHLKLLFTSTLPNLTIDSVDFQQVLHAASRNCCVETVSYLITACPSALVAVQNSNQTTALFRSVQNGRFFDFAKLLLDFGLHRHLNFHDRYGITPLQHLVSSISLPGQIEILDLFLEHGADPAVRDREGNTTFHCLARCLSNERKILVPILDALVSNSRLGAIDFLNNDGFSALGLAVINWREMGARVFLELGADVKLFSKNIESFPPAVLLRLWPAWPGKGPIFELLLDYGLDPEEKVNDGGKWKTLLQLARDDPEIKKILKPKSQISKCGKIQ
ncbi:hypothetical protein HK098_000227 [Nowakowskiella sp. JEL0407]|nr:hypothetical protein HK098_000227 [Nowakowskiella sp. JEL0407]